MSMVLEYTFKMFICSVSKSPGFLEPTQTSNITLQILMSKQKNKGYLLMQAEYAKHATNKSTANSSQLSR